MGATEVDEVSTTASPIYYYTMQVLVHIETGYEVMRGLFTLLGILIAVALFFKERVDKWWWPQKKATRDVAIQVNTFEVQQYGLHTVDELRAMCRARALRADGLKAALVERLSRSDHEGGGLYIPTANSVEQVPVAVVTQTLPPTTKQISYIRVLAGRQGRVIPPGRIVLWRVFSWIP